MGLWDDITSEVGGFIKNDVPGLLQDNVDFYAGLLTGDFGKSKNAFMDTVNRIGKRTNLLDDEKAPEGPTEVDGEPSLASATLDALQMERRNLARKRSMRTNMTGGAGLMDQAPTYSTALLGV